MNYDRLEKLAAVAIPDDGNEYGQQWQIDAESAFYNAFQAFAGDDALEEIQPFVSRTITPEGIAFALEKARYVATDRIARRFALLLRETFSAEVMAKIVGYNRQEEGTGICHSHDFCDANMVMEQAYREFMGFAPIDRPESDDALIIWNAAWNMAVTHEFWIEE